METEKGLKLERMKHEAIGEIVCNLSEITNQKDMEEIKEFVKNKVYEE